MKITITTHTIEFQCLFLGLLGGLLLGGFLLRSCLLLSSRLLLSCSLLLGCLYNIYESEVGIR